MERMEMVSSTRASHQSASRAGNNKNGDSSSTDVDSSTFSIPLQEESSGFLDETSASLRENNQMTESERIRKKKKKKKKDKRNHDGIIGTGKKKKRKSLMKEGTQKLSTIFASSTSIDTDIWDANKDDWSHWEIDPIISAKQAEALSGYSNHHSGAAQPENHTPTTTKSLTAHFQDSANGLQPESALPPSTNPNFDIMSVLSGDDIQSVNQVIENDDVPPDLLVDYMTALGASREVAQHLALLFISERKAAARGPAPTAFEIKSQEAERQSLKNPVRQAHAATVRRKLQETQQASQPPESATIRSLASVHSSDLVHAPPNPLLSSSHNNRNTSMNDHSSSSSQPRSTFRNSSNTNASMNEHSNGSSQPRSALRNSNNPAPLRSALRNSNTNTNAVYPGPKPNDFIVEARAISEEDDIEGGLPVIYADTTPISFKYLIRESPIRRFVILGACLLIGAITGIVVYFTTQGNKDLALAEGGLFPTQTPSMPPTLIEEDILQAAMTLSGEETLSEASSPQLRAVGWMSTVDAVDTGNLDRAFAQRYALATLYFSLKGEDWSNQEQWLDPTLHECDWSSRVVCEYDLSQFRAVTRLDATRNNLHGTLPAELGLLTSVSLLRMPKNSIRGQIPAAIGNLTDLADLDLSSNKFVGSIPSSIGQASDLNMIDLSKNQLNGTIPVDLFSLKVLRTLVLSENKLSGLVDKKIMDLQALVTLDIRKNELSGTFPLTFDTIPVLDIVYLDYNQFTGTLPKLSGSMIRKQILSLSHNRFSGNIEVDSTYILSPNMSDFRLQYADLSYNDLSGPISPIIGFLPTMRYFDLSGNGFYGTFPSNMGWSAIEFFAAADNALTGTLPVGLPTLTHLDMSFNKYSGGIPEAFCNYSKLQILKLKNNQLGGSIPTCLFDLAGMRALEVSNSGLNGTIPTEVGQMVELEYVDLMGNRLNGALPTEMGRLKGMINLELGQNLLTGTIPSELSNMTDLKVLHLMDNDLSGNLPSQLGELAMLESLQLTGNAIRGTVPASLCQSDTLDLTVQDIGCGIACECCADSGVCKN